MRLVLGVIDWCCIRRRTARYRLGSDAHDPAVNQSWTRPPVSVRHWESVEPCREMSPPVYSRAGAVRPPPLVPCAVGSKLPSIPGLHGPSAGLFETAVDRAFEVFGQILARLGEFRSDAVETVLDGRDARIGSSPIPCRSPVGSASSRFGDSRQCPCEPLDGVPWTGFRPALRYGTVRVRAVTDSRHSCAGFLGDVRKVPCE